MILTEYKVLEVSVKLMKQSCTFLVLILLLVPFMSRAQEDSLYASAQALKKLSLEDLMNIEVTLVSRATHCQQARRKCVGRVCTGGGVDFLFFNS